MPDWSYRTVLRPLLFLFPPETARDLSLRMIGRWVNHGSARR